MVRPSSVSSIWLYALCNRSLPLVRHWNVHIFIRIHGIEDIYICVCVYHWDCNIIVILLHGIIASIIGGVEFFEGTICSLWNFRLLYIRIYFTVTFVSAFIFSWENFFVIVLPFIIFNIVFQLNLPILIVTPFTYATDFFFFLLRCL